MNDVSILLEHINLLDGLDRLNIQLLKRRMELLVIGSSGLMDLLDFSSWSSLSSIYPQSAIGSKTFTDVLSVIIDLTKGRP